MKSWFWRMFRWQSLPPPPPAVPEEAQGVNEGLERLRAATRSMRSSERLPAFTDIEEIEQQIQEGVTEARSVFEKKT